MTTGVLRYAYLPSRLVSFISELELANQREEAANKREALALHEKKVAEQEKNLALAEIERLKALLAQKE